MSAAPVKKLPAGKKSAHQKRVLQLGAAGLLLVLVFLYVRSKGSASTSTAAAATPGAPVLDPQTGQWVDPSTGLPIGVPAASGSGGSSGGGSGGGTDTTSGSVVQPPLATVPGDIVTTPSATSTPIPVTIVGADGQPITVTTAPAPAPAPAPGRLVDHAGHDVFAVAPAPHVGAPSMHPVAYVETGNKTVSARRLASGAVITTLANGEQVEQAPGHTPYTIHAAGAPAVVRVTPAPAPHAAAPHHDVLPAHPVVHPAPAPHHVPAPAPKPHHSGGGHSLVT